MRGFLLWGLVPGLADPGSCVVQALVRGHLVPELPIPILSGIDRMAVQNHGVVVQLADPGVSYRVDFEIPHLAHGLLVPEVPIPVHGRLVRVVPKPVRDPFAQKIPTLTSDLRVRVAPLFDSCRIARARRIPRVVQISDSFQRPVLDHGLRVVQILVLDRIAR